MNNAQTFSHGISARKVERSLRWQIPWSLLALLCCLTFSGPDRAQAQHEDHAKGYELPFGNQPYLPSQAKTSFEGFLAPSDFPPASYCGKCHEGVHAQWRQSAHANSFRAPFYLKNVQLLIDQKGIANSRHCEGCHNPIALFTGALSRESKVNRAFDEDGITCSVCHSIEKIQSTSGTGSYILGRPAVMVDASGNAVPGLPTYDEILAHPERHRQAVMRPFYRTAEFCAVCHKAAVPQSLNDYRWLRMFTVYDEWQNSSWSRESPLTFYRKEAASTCQACHMKPEPVLNDYTRTAGQAASHRWLGANTAISAFYGYEEQLDKTTQFLKTALKIDLFGLEKEQPARRLAAPLGVQNVDLKAGETVVANVLVQNTGIGHNLVPEQRDIYECWVEFTAADALGKVFFRSGGLDDKGFLDPAAHTYTNRLLSASGKLLDMHQVWDTKLRGYDNTVPSGRSDLVRYRFRIPGDIKGPVVLSAKVNYRRFRRGYTNFILFPEQRAFPVVSLAAASITLNIGENRPVANADSKSVMLRWNNYGIALLGQQQYWMAEGAFNRVIELDPSYVDGYINLALARYSTLIETKRESPDGQGNLSASNKSVQEFEPVLKALSQALEKHPGDVRALYYKGIVFRHQGRLAEATELQKRVLNAFPRSRQARQELAYDYFLQGQINAARQEFEAVQDINPDDLTAHYYLSIIYARLGMTEQSRKEGTAYAQYREDPTVGSVAQGFWRANPPLVNELSPYHVHENVIKPPKAINVGGYLP
ncbi:MAG TPA: tetratricopeptide repeat protein [Candidatus Angelobacter sp.]|nr:tetratricopeptide repeat protein [Candidatus Angelobacter sp.]